jgi:hypothetical protein
MKPPGEAIIFAAGVARGALLFEGISSGMHEYILPPLPNTLYTRDTTCWIYGGVTLNPLYWPARHEEKPPSRRSRRSTRSATHRSPPPSRRRASRCRAC